MKAKIKVVILAEQSNLNEQLAVTVGRDWWDVIIQEDKVVVASRKDYEVPSPQWRDKDDMELDRKVHSLIDGVVGHVRNAIYMSYGLTLKWGYEAWYGHTHAINTLNLYPSIHQDGASTKYSPESLDIMRSIFNDLGTVKSPAVRTMMSYWRRAEELSDLSFHTEAYLNFFKVLESFEYMAENSAVRISLLDRFAPKGASGKDRVPMQRIRKHVGKSVSDGALVKHINKAAAIFASANYSVKITSGFFIYILDLIHIRNNYNVAHHLLRTLKNDSFMGVGQHSDEFEHVIPDLHNIKTVAKLMMLNYAYPGKYKYDSKEHSWELN